MRDKGSLKLFQEGKISFYASSGKISANLEVFYNPVMRTNRDITILFVKSILNTDSLKNEKEFLFLDGFSASGVRGLRLLCEGVNVILNDISPICCEVIKKNLEMNNLNATVENLAFDELILKYKYKYDFVDIDPFGTPNPYLDIAIRYAKNNSYIAVTSTDTAALTGTYPKVTKRKYWSNPMKNEMMHEMGLRTLIRKCQMIASQYDKALIVKLAYYKDHYFRVFFQVINDKNTTDEILNLHQYYFIDKFRNVILGNGYGPIYIGNLCIKDLIERMLALDLDISTETKKLLELLLMEYEKVGFLDLHTASKFGYIKKIPKISEVLHLTNATRTHFCNTAIKSPLRNEEIYNIINSKF